MSWITDDPEVVYEAFGSSQVSLITNEDSKPKANSRANSIWDTGNYGAPFAIEYNRYQRPALHIKR